MSSIKTYLIDGRHNEAFERCVYKTEIADIIKDSIDPNQYAYK